MKPRCVVYCIDGSINYQLMALRSALSLRQFNNTTVVFLSTHDCIIEIPKTLQPFNWVKFTAPFSKFPANMCMVGQLSDYEEILYLDSDTFVLQNIDIIFNHSSDSEFCGRLSTRFQNKENWKKDFDPLWRKILISKKSNYGPVINAGVCLYRKNVHSRIYNTWVELITEFYEGKIPEIYGGEYLYPQMSLSIALHIHGIKCGELNNLQHTFAWSNEPFSESVVYHTNSSLYNGVLNEMKKHIEVIRSI